MNVNDLFGKNVDAAGQRLWLRKRRLSETKTGFEEFNIWKKQVLAAYPEQASEIRFLNKGDGEISAEIPGVDRSFGVFDLETNSGQVLDEAHCLPCKQGVAEGYDTEELANEVYAEFERIYPNLARRADERTIHAAIIDVLNYGGDNDPGALAQDVARAVKQEMEQGLAEGEESDLRKLQIEWYHAMPEIMKKAGVDYKPVSQLSRGDMYPTLGKISVPGGSSYEYFTVTVSPKGNKAKVNISLNVESSNSLYRDPQPERAAKLNEFGEKIAQVLGGTQQQDKRTGERKNHPGVGSIEAVLELPKDTSWQNPSAGYDPLRRFLDQPGERARQSRVARSAYSDTFGGDASNYRKFNEQGVAEGSETAADIDKKIEFHKQGQAAAQYKGSMNKMHAAKIRELEAKKKQQGVAEGSDYEWEPLYHATLKAFEPSIIKSGLLPGGNLRMFDWSDKNYVYLSNYPDIASSFVDPGVIEPDAEHEEQILELMNQGGVIFKIDQNKLNRRLLRADPHFQRDDDTGEETYIYGGVIPPNAIIGKQYFSINESRQGVAEGSMNEIDHADSLDSSNISPNNLMQSGKVIGNIEGNDIVMLSKGNQTVYILKVDGEASAFVGFEGKNLKNIKNFTQSPGVIRALIGYLVHKKNMKIVISPNEPLTSDGLKWITRLINDPRGLVIKDHAGKDIDPEQLKHEWRTANKTGSPGTTGITISENIKFGNKLRENESKRNTGSLLMPFNFYSVRTKRQNVAENKKIHSDLKPKLMGLSFSDLERLSESAGDDFNKFNKNISKKLNLPEHKGIVSNTLNLYSVYRKQKIYESQNKNLSETEKKLFNIFNSRVGSTIDSVKPGDSVSLLMLSTLSIPKDKIFVNLQGFLDPKQIESITNANGIDYLHFVDGTKFPETDKNDPIQLAQSWAMTKLFDSYDTASKAYLMYALEGKKMSKEIQFNIDVDDEKDQMNEEGVAEGFSNDMSTQDMIAYLRQHHDKNLHPDYLNHLTSTNSKFVLKNIPLNSIRTELSGLDRAKVEQYKKMDFSKAPPIVVGSDGNILDGYHRATVAKALGIPNIKAYVGVKGQQGVAEAGPFSYGFKAPRKGSVADLAAKKRKEQERGKQPIEPKDQMVGVAKVITKGMAEGSEQSYKITYDIYGRNKEKPLYTNTRTVRASSEQEAIDILRKLIGGTNYRVEKQDVAEADKHSLIGKIQRGHELKKKVDSSWKDIGDAQKAGDKAAGSRAFRKHERYANLERPGTWTKVDEQGVAEGSLDPSGLIAAAQMVRNFIITAEVDGKTKKFRIRGMTGPGAAKERFLKHHSMAKVLDVKPEQGVAEGKSSDKLDIRHQDIRKQSGLPHPDYYKEMSKSYDIEDDAERRAHQADIRKKYGLKENVPEELDEDWQKTNKKDRTAGMSKKAVKAYRREHPGSKLQTAVTTEPSKLKKGSKPAKRRKSFCARSEGQKKAHNIDCSKTPDKAICAARRRWNCEESIRQLEQDLDKILSEDLRVDNPCWKGFHPVGTKKKDGRTVPNCVPGRADEQIDELPKNASKKS